MPNTGQPIPTDAVVIGAGPAGLWQAFQLGLLGVQTQLVDTGWIPSGQCAELYPDKPIYDIPGLPTVSGRGLVSALHAQLAPFLKSGSVQLQPTQRVNTLARQPDGRWQLGCSDPLERGPTFDTAAVVIAAGAGAFEPRRLNLPGIAELEYHQVFHNGGMDPLEVINEGLHVVVHGDDNRALSQVIALGKTAQLKPPPPGAPNCPPITLMHRRDVLKADDGLQRLFNELVESGHARFVVGQIAELVMNDAAPQTGKRLTALSVTLPDGSQITLPCDRLLLSVPMSPKLGPIASWGLDLERKQIPVDTERFQTQLPGVYAVGDINTYPGKKKLIVCAFHEATMAAYAIAAQVRPDEPLPLQYTTTSTQLLARLGVGPSGG